MEEVRIKVNSVEDMRRLSEIMNKYEHLEFDVGSSRASVVDGKSINGMLGLTTSNLKCFIHGEHDKDKKSFKEEIIQFAY